MAEDRLSQEERDEPEYLNSGLALKRFHHLLPYPLNGVRRLSRMWTFDQGRYWTPGLAVSKRWRWEKLPLETFELTSVESAGKSSGGTKTTQISRTTRMKPEVHNQTRFLHLVMPRRRASSGGYGGFLPMKVGFG